MTVFIWRIFHSDIENKTLFQNRFSIRKSIKTIFPVIGSDTAVALPTKRKMVVHRMADRIIDTSSAKRYP